MKKFFIILFFLFSLLFKAQVISDYKLPTSKQTSTISIMGINGTCASPNGNMNPIGAPPGSYAALQAGGYCKPFSYGKNGTVCWSFIPTSTSIIINSGYSSIGCAGVGFGPFTLFNCAPSCAVVGSGLSFSVISGQCYTWCMTYSGIGGACTFNDFCPYYQQFTVLPIELSYFAGSSQGNINILQWKTETETNNSYFDIEISNDAVKWEKLVKINALGNYNIQQIYLYKHENFNRGINYYRLKQVDKDGTFSYHGIVVINNTKTSEEKIIRILNILGQDVELNYEGIKIIHYSDGNIVKQL